MILEKLGRMLVTSAGGGENQNKSLVFMARTDACLKNQMEIVLTYIHFIAFSKCKQEVATFGHEHAEWEFFCFSVQKKKEV